ENERQTHHRRGHTRAADGCDGVARWRQALRTDRRGADPDERLRYHATGDHAGNAQDGRRCEGDLPLGGRSDSVTMSRLLSLVTLLVIASAARGQTGATRLAIAPRSTLVLTGSSNLARWQCRGAAPQGT